VKLDMSAKFSKTAAQGSVTIVGKRILLINAHPDPDAACFVAALAAEYEAGARDGGHELRQLRVGAMKFSVLRTRQEWEQGGIDVEIERAQADVAWAEHLVILYPLWLGDLPALAKAFFEQVFRPGFAFEIRGQGWRSRLKGRSAHVVVTMGMPASYYRWFYRAHSLHSLERNILSFVGIRPVRRSIIGLVESNARARRRWLTRMRQLGRRAG
jgi:putative NADPH-quinone reductase